MVKNVLAVGIVFLSACSSSVVDTTSGPDTTSTPATTSAPSSEFGRAEVEALIADIGLIDTLDQTRQVVEVVGLINEPDLIPYAFDAARLGDTETLRNAIRILSRVTGETPQTANAGDQWLFFGNWLMDNVPDPGPAYVEWKAALFGNIDPAFEPLIAAVPDAVTASRLQWGGVRRGGIPELNDAATISVAEAGYMVDDELVFGAVINGEARAYPVRILGHHELANDTLGGVEVSLAYCTLCRTAVLYRAAADGMTLAFETSGLLMNSNKVMVDVQTDTLWNQLTGEAFAGPLAGTMLEKLPLTVTTWADWVAEHPDTDVQTVAALTRDDDPTELTPTGGFSYQPGDAYAGYYAGNAIWFPVFSVPDHFAPKDEVVTLDYAGSQLAAGLGSLLEAGGLVTELGGAPVVLVASEGGARAYQGAAGLEVLEGEILFEGELVTAGEDALVLPDGTELARLISGQSFWFAWYGNFPDTEWWPQA